MLPEEMSSDDFKDEELVEDFSIDYCGLIRTVFYIGDFSYVLALSTDLDLDNFEAWDWDFL